MQPKVDDLGQFIIENIRVSCPIGYFGDDDAVEEYVRNMYNDIGVTVDATVIDSDEDDGVDEYIVRVNYEQEMFLHKNFS